MRRSILSAFLMLVFVATVSIQPAAAKQFTLWGKALNLFAFASQTGQISLKGDEYFVEEGLQQALLQVFGEVDYRPRHDVTLYVSGIHCWLEPVGSCWGGIIPRTCWQDGLLACHGLSCAGW